MKKETNHAEVNSSFTVFFILSLLVLSWLFSGLFQETKYQSLFVIFLFGLLLYFIWDFIKQLFNPGQAVILFTLTFIILPFIMNLIFDFPYGRLGGIVLFTSYVLARCLEFIYERLVKPKSQQRYFKTILQLDNKMDKSLINLSTNHVYVSDFKGMVFALTLIVAYFAGAYLLLHN